MSFQDITDQISWKSARNRVCVSHSAATGTAPANGSHSWNFNDLLRNVCVSFWNDNAKPSSINARVFNMMMIGEILHQTAEPSVRGWLQFVEADKIIDGKALFRNVKNLIDNPKLQTITLRNRRPVIWKKSKLEVF